MTPEERQKQIDRLARAHADACRVGDRELARILFRRMNRHARILDRDLLTTDPHPLDPD